MGLFLSMSGVIGADAAAAEEALRDYSRENHGMMVLEPLSTDDGCLTLSESTGGCTVLYPHEFLGWDDASEFLSRSLRKPVFSFHIHDGDFWMYILYADGREIDRFNPI